MNAVTDRFSYECSRLPVFSFFFWVSFGNYFSYFIIRDEKGQGYTEIRIKRKKSAVKSFFFPSTSKEKLRN